MEHTKEPWGIAGTRGNGDIQIEGAAGDLICLIYEDGGKIDKHDARRIVACVNACAGIRTEELEFQAALGLGASYVALKQQRDELLAVLEKCAAKFREYEAIHSAKPDLEKAARNAEMARMAEAAIAVAKGDTK